MIHFVLSDKIHALYRSILEDNETNYSKHFILVSLFCVLLNVTNGLVYYLEDHLIVIPELWITRITKNGCIIDSSRSNSFQKASLSHLTTTNAFFGAYYGLLLQSRFYPNFT
jgi:hypothetical protein